MSTKIYFARRVSIAKLNDVLDDVREQLLGLAAKRVWDLIPGVKLPDDWREGKAPTDWALCELHERFRCVLQAAKTVGASPYRDPVFDLRCGINIWLRCSFAYLIPIAEPWMLQRLKWPASCEDFCYWDNTDEPVGMSRRAWALRRRTWEQVNCGTGTAEHNARRLYHEVIDVNRGAYAEFILWDRVRALKGAP